MANEKGALKRSESFDLLRVIAAVAVVIIHVGAMQWRAIDINSSQWLIITVWNMLCKFSVPVFFMVSGAFLLDESHKTDIKTILTKRLPKIIAAFVFWSSIYTAVNIFRTDDLRANIKWIIVEFFTGEYHMWFLFAIACLYIVTPLLKVIAKNRELCGYYLALFALFQFVLPFVSALPKVGVFVIEATEKAQLQFVMGFSGYYVLGFYLRRYPVKGKAKALLYGAGIIGAAYTVVSVVVKSRNGGAPDETSAEYLTWNVAVMSAAVYTFVLSVFEKRNFKKNVGAVICSFSSYSFGIYLAHPLFLWIFEWIGFVPTLFTPVLSVPVIALCATALSFALSWLLRKIPKIGKMIT